MLCKRIFFTDDMLCESGRMSEYLTRRGIRHKAYQTGDNAVIEAEADDEELYLVSCELSGYIKDICIKKAVMHRLYKQYDCFNSDERRIIYCNIIEKNFISELAGRIYIYIKITGSINPFSFYHFMCKDIAQDVTECVGEEAEKIIALNDNSDFIGILKCFSAVSMENTDFVELICDNRGIHLTPGCDKNENFMTEYASDDADVLAELVTLNPRRIDVFGKEEFLKNELSAVITAVFEDRIQYK